MTFDEFEAICKDLPTQAVCNVTMTAKEVPVKLQEAVAQLSGVISYAVQLGYEVDVGPSDVGGIFKIILRLKTEDGLTAGYELQPKVTKLEKATLQ